MASLFYPQLSTGAVAQYPIQKVRSLRTVQNVLPDGSCIVFQDANASAFRWSWNYVGLGAADISLIEQFFAACSGRLHAFTFIDPTENMCLFSSDLASAAWASDPGIEITSGAADPCGGNAAFSVVNTSQVTARISQTMQVPSAYQYCFSVYATAATPVQVELQRSGPTTQAADMETVTSSWTRLVSSGALNDNGTGFSTSISLPAGQSVTLYGPQGEPQIAPSRYRPTQGRGAVFSNAHWAVDRLLTVQDGPGLFSASVSIEAAS